MCIRTLNSDLNSIYFYLPDISLIPLPGQESIWPWSSWWPMIMWRDCRSKTRVFLSNTPNTSWEGYSQKGIYVLLRAPRAAGAHNICLMDAYRISWILRVTFAWHMRQITRRMRASHPRIRRKCCAHLPHEECATRDVTFGPLCIGLLVIKGVYFQCRFLRSLYRSGRFCELGLKFRNKNKLKMLLEPQKYPLFTVTIQWNHHFLIDVIGKIDETFPSEQKCRWLSVTFEGTALV
jgi:hypothetical protein